MAIFGAKQDGGEVKATAKKTVKKPAAAKAPKKNEENKEAEKSMQDLYAETSVKKVAKKIAATKYEGAYRVLERPLITEKATDFAAQNKYAFVVSDKANKIEVAKAVQTVYGVKPVKVNIVTVMGKKVRRGRITGQRKDWKKAVVTLKKGESIQIYEGV